jgi:hypothetical protein
MRASKGDGTITESTFDFERQGVFLAELKTTARSFGVTDVTDLVANPPVLVAPTGVAPGQTLEFDIAGSGENVHVRITFVRTERLTIGGQGVEAIVTHQVDTLSGKVAGTQTSDSWISPQTSLSLKDHTVLDATAYGAKVQSDTMSTLRSLTPT